MKKFKTLFVVLCTCLALAGCSSKTAEETSEAIFANPGTYSATVQGRNGDLTVTATFTESKIESIECDNEETVGIGTTAIDSLIETITENQSIAVDVVSGATVSSNAFMDALKDCIEQAGGDLEALNGEVTASTVTYDETEADIVIVGAGGAGLMAALAASEDGASVILLEKSSSVGGNTLCAANGINAYDSDVQLADEAYQAADTSRDGFIDLQTNELSRQNLVEAFIDNSAEAINYLSDLGVEFEVEISNDDRNSSQNYYLLQATEMGTTMTTVVSYLNKALEASDVTLYTETEVTSLVTDDNGTVTGVKATGVNGEDLTFTGKEVILCTGGFGQNSELVGEVNPSLANAITDETAPTTGQGLLMAQDIGADAVDLDQIQTFPVVIKGYGMVLPMTLPGGFPLNGTIYVNNDGERFVSEAFEVPNEILAQDQGEAYAIFTEENLNDTMKSLMDLGFVVSGETAEELAENLGIDADGLAATIAKWNEDAATGTDSVFGREGISAFEGTLYGYKFGVGAHYFMGGILINENTQVLDTEGNVIEGLYAAGEVTGGFHGSQRVDGSGTGDAIVFGRLAGHKAAEAAK